VAVWYNNCGGGGGGSTTVDNDNDGYNSNVDCNDNNPAINPGAIEICGNNVDEDCSGVADICRPIGTTAAAGVWYGTTTDNTYHTTEDIFGVATTDGQIRLLIDSGECEGSQYEGTFSMNGNAGSGTITGHAISGCLFANGQPITTGTVNFTISGTNLTGNYSTTGTSGTLALTYDSLAEIPITLAGLEGQWGYIINGGLDWIDINMSNNGSFDGTNSSGCEFSGQVSIIDPNWSITNISLTASNCNDLIFNGSYSGLGLLVTDAMPELFVLMVSKSNLSYVDILDLLRSGPGPYN
jgi:hypothetical protein